MTDFNQILNPLLGPVSELENQLITLIGDNANNIANVSNTIINAAGVLTLTSGNTSNITVSGTVSNPVIDTVQPGAPLQLIYSGCI